MTRPDWCDEKTWAEVNAICVYTETDDEGVSYVTDFGLADIARALLSAKEEARKAQVGRDAALAMGIAEYYRANKNPDAAWAADQVSAAIRNGDAS